MEYNAASDAYTNAPEDFKELFNQVSASATQTLSTDIMSPVKNTKTQKLTNVFIVFTYNIQNLHMSII